MAEPLFTRVDRPVGKLFGDEEDGDAVVFFFGVAEHNAVVLDLAEAVGLGADDVLTVFGVRYEHRGYVGFFQHGGCMLESFFRKKGYRVYRMMILLV